MKSGKQKSKKEEEITNSATAGLGRRDLMKLGAGVVVTSLAAGSVSAQEMQGGDAPKPARGRGAAPVPTGIVTVTGAGYVNNANRISGNGPMDNTSRALVEYVTKTDESILTPTVLSGISDTMVDSMAALVAGFDSEVGRITAKIGRQNQSEMKCTIAGYGVTTNPESAAFANSSMIRHTDYNDGDPGNGGHTSVIIPGIMAIGEAMHSTGPQLLVALAIGYEILNGIQHAARGGGGGGGLDAPYEGVATALACGKLMGLNEDRLANALSIALVPHLPLSVTHQGALSHWKGCHSAMGVRNGVYAALLAREGMTGPAQPFEGRNGMWDKMTGPFKEMVLPVSPEGKLAMANFRKKRYPAEGNSQAMLQQAIPPIREFTKADNIESIRIEMSFGSWQEIGDPPKWDPRNRETADHSMPFMTAIALTDGEVYINSFQPKRYLEDQGIRGLMGRITIQANPEFDRQKQGRTRFTVKTKDGKQLVKDVFEENPMTRAEIDAKFVRISDYMSVPPDQRDKAHATWSAIEKVHDVAEPIRAFGKYGRTLTT